MKPKQCGKTSSLSEESILLEVFRSSSYEDWCTIEGLDSQSGKPFSINFVDLMNKKDTIQEAVDRYGK